MQRERGRTRRTEDVRRAVLARQRVAKLRHMHGLFGHGHYEVDVFVVDHALQRSGARVGDQIWVGGQPGDAAGGLACWPRRGAADAHVDALISAFLYPQPQVELGQSLASRANAAIDVSDGLVADLGHICRASSCGAVIHTERLPLSDSLVSTVGRERAEQLALAGGDDYVLLFTAPADFQFSDCSVIGDIIAGDGVEVRRNGSVINLDSRGYEHFRVS